MKGARKPVDAVGGASRSVGHVMGLDGVGSMPGGIGGGFRRRTISRLRTRAPDRGE